MYLKALHHIDQSSRLILWRDIAKINILYVIYQGLSPCYNIVLGAARWLTELKVPTHIGRLRVFVTPGIRRSDKLSETHAHE